MTIKSDKARARESQRRYRRNVEKLQKAGLLGKINLRSKRDLSARRAIIKYREFLSGKVAAVKAPSPAAASHIKGKFKLKGRGQTVLIPREGKEKFTISKTGDISSVRTNPLNRSEKITRKYAGQGAKPPKDNERVYYTIRERRRGLGTLKRTTFAKFDDLLEYLAAYDLNWEDIEPYIETETININQRKAKGYDKTISEERRAGHKRWARRHKKANKKPSTKHGNRARKPQSKRRSK